jgi:hypothetical protein
VAFVVSYLSVDRVQYNVHCVVHQNDLVATCDKFLHEYGMSHVFDRLTDVREEEDLYVRKRFQRVGFILSCEQPIDTNLILTLFPCVDVVLKTDSLT